MRSKNGGISRLIEVFRLFYSQQSHLTDSVFRIGEDGFFSYSNPSVSPDGGDFYFSADSGSRAILNLLPIFISELFMAAAGADAGRRFRKWTGLLDYPAPELKCSAAMLDQCLEELKSTFDPLGTLSQSLILPAQRRRDGEFYTPEYLAAALFQEAMTELAQSSENKENMPSILDPACGSGRFLILAVRYFRTKGIPFSVIWSRIAGMDRNPYSVFLARAAIALECWRLGEIEEAFEAVSSGSFPFCPIFCRDLIQKKTDQTQQNQRRFDLIIGNPPWLVWDRLPAEYRQKTEPLWREYGLFSLSGKEARLGGGKKELAGLFLFTAADGCLKPGGLLASVIPMSLLKSGRSGEGFRLLRRGTDGELGLLRIGDYSAVHPFSPLSVQAGTILLRQGTETCYPVPGRIWKKNRSGTLAADEIQAVLSEPNRPGSALRFLTRDQKKKEQFFRDTVRIGGEKGLPTAQLGVNTAGANGLFWLTPADDEALYGLKNGVPTVRMRNLPALGKRSFPEQTVELETELLYPLLRWRDVGEGTANPSVWLLMPHDPVRRRGIDESTLQSRYPLTARYLAPFETMLRQRAAYRKWLSNGPFWSLFNIGPDSLASYKTVWRRMDKQLTAAAVGTGLGGKPILPQETLSFIPAVTQDEAVYYADLLNSDKIRQQAAEVSLPGSKGFGSPGLFRLLSLTPYPG